MRALRCVYLLMSVWCTVTEIGPDGTTVAEWMLHGCGPPGVEIVDDLAARQVAARRAGGRLALTDVCDDLARLIDLVGLRDTLLGGQPIPRRPSVSG